LACVLRYSRAAAHPPMRAMTRPARASTRRVPVPVLSRLVPVPPRSVLAPVRWTSAIRSRWLRSAPAPAPVASSHRARVLGAERCALMARLPVNRARAPRSTRPPGRPRPHLRARTAPSAVAESETSGPPTTDDHATWRRGACLRDGSAAHRRRGASPRRCLWVSGPVLRARGAEHGERGVYREQLLLHGVAPFTPDRGSCGGSTVARSGWVGHARTCTSSLHEPPRRFATCAARCGYVMLWRSANRTTLSL